MTRTVTEIAADARTWREEAAARTVDLHLPWRRVDNAVYDRDGRLVFCVSIEGRRDDLSEALSVARQLVDLTGVVERVRAVAQQLRDMDNFDGVDAETVALKTWAVLLLALDPVSTAEIPASSGRDTLPLEDEETGVVTRSPKMEASLAALPDKTRRDVRWLLDRPEDPGPTPPTTVMAEFAGHDPVLYGCLTLACRQRWENRYHNARRVYLDWRAREAAETGEAT